MTKTLALVLVFALTLTSALPVFAQSASQWKPEVRFIKIGVSSAGGDWFRAHGGRTHPENAKVALPKAKNLFVSFDLDVLDAAHAPGVSALNPAGWNVREAEAWVRACGADPRVRCFDLMELNPAHDPDGRTARVAAHLFLSFLQGFAQR